MLKRLTLDTDISSILRTRRRQDVEATTQAVLDRVGQDPAFAPLVNSYVYSTLHHYQPKSEPFDWQTTPQALLADLVNEPRASLSLKGPNPGGHLSLHFNCENEIVKEKVDGKRRNVPKASERSTAGIYVSARYFVDAAFVQAYLDLASDLFKIIEGEYGYARHLSIRPGNDFDRIHQVFFEPWYITWANFFGPELVARLGRDRLLDAPAHQVWELPGGSIVLTIAASPLEQLNPEVQERIAHVKAHLDILSPSERAAPEELAAFESHSTAAEAEMKQRIEEAFRHARARTAAEMQRQAEGCVEGVRRFWGVTLDFDPQSLTAVDRLIQTGFDRQADDETITTAVQAFGAYVGEVVRRSLGGVWHDEEMKGQPVLLDVGRDSVRVEPFRIVSRRFKRTSDKGYALPDWYEQIRHQAT